MSVFVLAEAMFIPVMVLALWTWSQALQQPRWGQVLAWSLVAGLMNGQAILIRPSWLLFPPLVSLLLLACFGQRSRTFLSAVVVGLGIIVAMTPWWYRNYQLTDRFVPTTLQVGASLYDGGNPQADGSSDMSHGYRIEEEVRQSVLTQGIENNWTDQEIAVQQELTANDRLSQAARVWASEHPWQLVKLFFVKVGRTWRPWPIADEASSPAMQWLVGASMVLILIFAVPQLFRAFQAPAWMLLFFPTVYFTVLHGVFVGSIRYRQPAVFLLVPFAAIGFHLTCRWLLSSRGNTTDTGKGPLHKKTATQG